MRALRARMQMVFQDPYSAIDPRYTIRDAVTEPFDIQGRRYTATEKDTKTAELLDMVGLSGHLANSYPHQMSGGQKQRVGIARALALDPRYWCWMSRPHRWTYRSRRRSSACWNSCGTSLNLTYMFICHDLSLVKYFCDEVLVMYLGRVVEVLPDTEAAARHPYTRTLLDSTFDPDPAAPYNRAADR